MPFLKRSLITLSMLVLSYSLMLAQFVAGTEAENIVQKTEKILGADDLLVNGTRYLPENLHATGSPDFEQISGESALFIKGQGFYKIQLAYDIVSDRLVLVLPLGNGLENRIQLYSSFVDSFKIGNSLFINIHNLPGEFQQTGFYEQVATGEIRFLKKYTKKYLQIYDASNRGKYSPQSFSCYLLNREGKLSQINNRIQFLKHFGENKKQVRNYLNDHSINLRKAGNAQLRELMFFCNTLKG